MVELDAGCKEARNGARHQHFPDPPLDVSGMQHRALLVLAASRCIHVCSHNYPVSMTKVTLHCPSSAPARIQGGNVQNAAGMCLQWG